MTRRPFTLETIIPYLGRNLRPIIKNYGSYSSKKRSPKSGIMLFAAGIDHIVIKNRVSRSLTEVSYPALLNQYVLDDGSPCGLTITCRDGDGRVLAEKLPPEAPVVQPARFLPMNMADRFLIIKEDLVSMSLEELSALDTHDILRYTQTIEKYLKTMLNIV